MKPTVPSPPSKVTPAVYFDVNEFDKLVEARGMDLLWSRALYCPCRLAESRNPDPTCPMCAGTGWHYVNPRWHERPSEDPTAPLPVRAVLAQIGLDVDQFQPMGAWFTSDAMITLRGPIRIGFRDRFVALEQELAWSESLIRVVGEGSVGVGLQGRPSSEWDTVFRYPPVRINHVVDANNVRYRERLDFRLVGTTPAGSRFQWLAGRGPAPGVRWSVHYVCRPVWVVEQATFAVQHSRGPVGANKGNIAQQDLPTTFKVRLDFLSRVKEG